jgi:predicted nucleotidyltransferase
MQSVMPVRSLNSSVLKWPDQETVARAVDSWSAEQAAIRSDIIRIGYFGSYARNDWGVGSDLDVIAIIEESAEPFERRSLLWDLSGLPVPADIIVYTLLEWKSLMQRETKFVRMLQHEVVWTFSIAT